MATYNDYESGINSMTEEIFNSLKDSDGKIPSLANQLVMTDDENSENCIELISSNNISNGGTITADFSKYRFLFVEARRIDGIMGTFIVSLTSTDDYGRYVGCFSRTKYDTSFSNYLNLYWEVIVNSAKSQATITAGFYNYANFSGSYSIGKVWGIK